jgi:hypothetical protein
LPESDMNISDQEQDITPLDSVRQRSDTSVKEQSHQADTTRIRDSLRLKKKEIKKTIEFPAITDTVSVSNRSHISDITFYDTVNIITRIDRGRTKEFPFIFIEKNKIRKAESNNFLQHSLKEGEELVVKPFHDDWIIFVILIAAFFYASIQTLSKKLFPGLIRFFLFRGVGDSAARETSELFHWQSTIINLISFFNIALFVYCAAFYYDFNLSGISGIFLWLIAFVIIVAAITLRHLGCIITGNLSGQKEIFDEYIVIIYQSYRYLALILFILVILLSYTTFFAAKTLLFTGFISLAALYLMRILRLFMIFIKRNVSILYLILYLCALEFLPVTIVLKYFTGLF